MADFKVIETQEQLDAIIGERLKRQAEKLEEKFSKYLSPDDVSAKNEELNVQIAELNKALEEEKGKTGEYTSEIERLTAQIKKHESDSAKNRIAAELGLPYQLAQRLTGETEEDLRKDAESLVGIIGKQSTPPPLATSEGTTKNDNADLKAMLKELKGE